MALDGREHGAERVGMLEEWMRGLMGGGKEDEARGVFRDAVDDGGRGCGWGGPERKTASIFLSAG